MATGAKIEVQAANGDLVADAYGDSIDEADNIGRLIAAAPELLAACEEWLEIDGPYVSLAEQRKRWSDVLRRMAAAAERATGRRGGHPRRRRRLCERPTAAQPAETHPQAGRRRHRKGAGK